LIQKLKRASKAVRLKSALEPFISNNHHRKLADKAQIAQSAEKLKGPSGFRATRRSAAPSVLSDPDAVCIASLRQARYYLKNL
jgi:hypothetical protein